MTEFIGSLDRSSTTGEKKVYRIFEKVFQDKKDTFCYYEPLVGEYRPDFVILEASWGALVVEVKDYSPRTLRDVTATSKWEKTTRSGTEYIENPFDQLYKYWKIIKRRIKLKDTAFKQKDLIQQLVVFPFIERESIQGQTIIAKKPQKVSVFFQEDVTSYKNFERSLQNIKPHNISLNPKHIDNLRGNLVLTSRLPQIKQKRMYTYFPAIDSEKKLKLLDYQQEQLATDIGEGHRLIFGVAGSGKTVILIARAKYLAKLHKDWRILVLCYNKLLNKHLQHLINPQNFEAEVEVTHYHKWAKDVITSSTDEFRALYEELKDSFIKIQNKDEFFSQVVPQLLRKVLDETDIEPYDAILIDEAQDFEELWFKTIMQVLNPQTNSLLVTCDGLQGIYARKRFYWSDVGIQARGRVRRFYKTYRNPERIGKLAYNFLSRDKNLMELIEQNDEFLHTEGYQRTGGHVTIKMFKQRQEEYENIISNLKQYSERNWSTLILFPKNLAKQRKPHPLIALMNKHNILWHHLEELGIKKGGVSIGTLQGTKGLEADAAVIPELDKIYTHTQNRQLVYVGMTRALNDLLMTASKKSQFTRDLEKLFYKLN